MSTNAAPTGGLDALQRLLSQRLKAQGNSLGEADWLNVITHKLAAGALSINTIGGLDAFKNYLQDIKSRAQALQTYYAQRQSVYNRLGTDLTQVVNGSFYTSNPALDPNSVSAVSNAVLAAYNTATAAGSALPSLVNALTTAANATSPAVSVSDLTTWATSVFGASSALTSALSRSEVTTWLNQLSTRTQALDTFYTARLSETQARLAILDGAVGAYDLSNTSNANRLTGLNNLVTNLTSVIQNTNWANNPSRDLAGWLDTNAGANTTRTQLRTWALATFGASSALAAAVPATGASAVSQVQWQSALDEITQLRDQFKLTQAATVTTGAPATQTAVTALGNAISDAKFQSWVEHDNFYTSINANVSMNGLGLTAADVRSWAATLLGSSSALVTALDKGSAAPPVDVTFNEWLVATRQLNELKTWMSSRSQLASARSLANDAVTSAQTASNEVKAGLKAMQLLNDAAATSGAALATQWQALSTAAGAGALGTLLTGTTPAAYTGSLQAWLRRFDVNASYLTASSATQLSLTYNTYSTGVTAAPTTVTLTLDPTADAMGQSRTASLTGSPSGLSALAVLQQAVISAQTSNANTFAFFDNSAWTTWQVNKTGAAAGYSDATVNTRMTGGPSSRTDWVRALQELQQLPAFAKLTAQDDVAKAFAIASGTATQQSTRVTAGLNAINQLQTAAANGTLVATVASLKTTYASYLSESGINGDLFAWLRTFDVPADQLTSPVPNSVTLSTRVYSGDTDVTGTALTVTRPFASTGAALSGLSTTMGPGGALPGLSEYDLGLVSLVNTLATDSTDFFDGTEWTQWRTNPVGARSGYTEASVTAVLASSFTSATANSIASEAASIVSKIQNLGVLQSSGGSSSLTYATQILDSLGSPLSDPARRQELSTSLDQLLTLINSQVNAGLNQVDRNMQLQERLALLNTQWGVTDFLSRITSGRLTQDKLAGLSQLRSYLTATKGRTEALRTFYTDRQTDAQARLDAYNKIMGVADPAGASATLDRVTALQNVIKLVDADIANWNPNTPISALDDIWKGAFWVEGHYNAKITVNGQLVNDPAYFRTPAFTALNFRTWSQKYFGLPNPVNNLWSTTTHTLAQFQEFSTALKKMLGDAMSATLVSQPLKMDRLEAMYASLRDQGFSATLYFKQQVSSFGSSTDPHDTWATLAANQRPASERIDPSDLSMLAENLFGSDSKIKAALDAGNV
jgi:hypothetical protein